MVRILIVVASIVATFMLLVAICLNFIVTPEMLTPLVHKYADKYLDADVKLKSVEATFFSSFPRFGLKIVDGVVVGHAFHQQDSVATKADTLVVFDELRLGINLMRYLIDGELSIGRARIRHPQVRLFKNEYGVCNWDIVKESDTANADTTESDMPITLRRITIDNAQINYSDRTTKTNLYLADFNLFADGDMNLQTLDVDMRLSDRTTHLMVNNSQYIRGMSLGIDGHVEYDMESGKYVLKETNMDIDDSKLFMDGWLEPDSVGLDVNVRFGIETPRVEDLFAQIPKEYISAPIDVEGGFVSLSGTVVGALTNSTYPVVNCKAEIDKVKAQYEGMDYPIEDLSALFTACLDAQNPTSSYLRIEKLYFLGGNSEIDASLNVEELLSDARVSGHIKTDVALSSLSKVLPLENTTMQGVVNADMDINFRLSHIIDSDYGRMRFKGVVDIDSLKVINDTIGFSLQNDAHLLFKGSDTLKVIVDVDRLLLRNDNLRIRVTDFHAKAKTLMERDSTSIATIICQARANRFSFRSDTLRIFAKHLESDNELRPMKNNKKQPYVNIGMRCDTILSSIYGTRGITEMLNSSMMLAKENDTLWNSKGDLQLRRIRVGIPQYAMPIEAEDIHVTQGEREIKIESCKVKTGHSSMSMSGSIHNLYYAIKTGTPLNATLDMEADTINFNELLSAIVKDEEERVSTVSSLNDSTMVVATTDNLVATDSMPNQIFVIPEFLNFKIGAKAEHVVWSKLNFKRVRGHLQVTNGALHMTDLVFRQGESRAITIMSYKANEMKDKANINCFVRWEKADIEEIVSSIGIDSLMPMMKPLKGTVDCYFAAKMQMDSTLTVDLNTLKASMHVGAKRLTLLDTETFAKISKVLMFKNKKENYMDTLSFNVLVDTGYVRLLPFVANMDRYKAVVGGEQDVNMSKLKYHVSILKSPLLFKAGVNIEGTLEDIDIDITTAKLKKHADVATQTKYDDMSLSVRMEILRETYEMSGIKIPERLSKNQ